jgi:DNA-binding HxlR family transcriptional regulator
MRTYDLRCPIACTLDVIGERWTLLIVRELFKSEVVKFADLEMSLAGISPTTLSIRLRDLEAAGVLCKRYYEDHPPRAEYLLTNKGRALGPIIRAMKDWGECYRPHSPTP